MKRSLVCSLTSLLLLLSFQSFGQEIGTFIISEFRGNPISRSVTLSPADTLSTVTVTAYNAPNGQPLAPSLQPIVSRSGLKLRFGWASTNSLPATGWIQVRSGPSVRFAGTLAINNFGGVPPALPPGGGSLVSFDKITDLPLYLNESVIEGKASISSVLSLSTALTQKASLTELASLSAAVAGKLGLVWKGAWQAQTTYAPNDAVTNGGNSYGRITAGTSGSTFDPAQWALLAQGGSVSDNSVTAVKLAAGAVTPEKTSFSTPGGNLYNRLDADNRAGYYVYSVNGAILSNALYTASPFIPVTPGQAYFPAIKQQLAYYDANKVFVSGEDALRANQSTTAPAGAAFIRLTMTNATTFYLKAGSTDTGWEPFVWLDGSLVKLPAGKVKAENLDAGAVTNAKVAPRTLGWDKMDFVVASKNLFDLTSEGNVLDSYIFATNGAVLANGSYNATHFIAVTPGQTYVPTIKNQLAFYDAGKVFISGLDGSRTNTQFTVPAGAAYLRLSVLKTNWSTFQIEVGSTATSYAPFALSLVGISASLNPRQVKQTHLELESVGSDQLAKGAVAPANTRFIQKGRNLFNRLAGTEGKYINEVGTELTNAIYGYSDYIAVTPGQAYSGRDGNGIGMRFTCYYTATKAVVPGGSSVAVTGFTPPAGAAFVRITYTLTGKTTFILSAGAYTFFEPFAYLAQDSDGTPIQASADRTSVLAILDSYTEPGAVAVAPKLYTPAGREIVVYSENIHRNFLPFRDKTEVVITGGKTTGRGGRITPVTSGTTAGLVRVGDRNFNVLLTSAFTVVATPTTNVNALKILNIGDSYTYRSTFANALLTTAGTNLTFLGTRNANATTTPILSEGRGGWAVSTYSTLNTNLYSPFVQPGLGSYVYLGNTDFWKAANVATPGYDYAGFPVATRFNATTGYPVSPAVNEVIYDNAQAKFVAWNGGAWVDISQASLAFSVNFAKYRTAWSIAAADVVHIMLGTNDFAGATETTFPGLYSTYKTQYNALLASIRSSLPTAKIIVGIPVSSGRQGEFDTYETGRRKRAYWLLAQNLLADFGSRESEGIYLVDYHSTVDRVYGYDNTAEKPYANYSGAAREDYKADFIHLGADGFKQMADGYFGVIQAVR